MTNDDGPIPPGGLTDRTSSTGGPNNQTRTDQPDLL
jgi:hypothetical protein